MATAIKTDFKNPHAVDSIRQNDGLVGYGISGYLSKFLLGAKVERLSSNPEKFNKEDITARIDELNRAIEILQNAKSYFEGVLKEEKKWRSQT